MQIKLFSDNRQAISIKKITLFSSKQALRYTPSLEAKRGRNMAQISTNEFKAGIKIEMDGQPFLIVSNEFVKPGKGQAFNRVRLKHLITARVVEKTFKSGEKVELADIEES